MPAANTPETPLSPEPDFGGLNMVLTALVIASSLLLYGAWPGAATNVVLVGALACILVRAQVGNWMARQRKALGLPPEAEGQNEPFKGRFSLMELILIVVVAFLVIGFVVAPLLVGSAEKMVAIQRDAWRCLTVMILTALGTGALLYLRRRAWGSALLCILFITCMLGYPYAGPTTCYLALYLYLALHGLIGLYSHRRWLAWARDRRAWLQRAAETTRV